MNELIDIKELRIGNLLSYDNKVVYITSLSMDIDDEYEDQIGFCNVGESSNEKGGWNRSLVDKLAPIPITPELLGRCGFKKLNAGWINDSGSLTFYVKSQDANGYYKMAYGTRNYNARFLFVHQLQNLYFALTGEELTIK